MLSVVFVQESSDFFQARAFLPDKMECLDTSLSSTSKSQVGRFGFTCFVNMLLFCKYVFSHMYMKVGRATSNCGYVSVSTARSARSNNSNKTPEKTKPESEVYGLAVGEIRLVAYFALLENVMVSTRVFLSWSPN